MLVALASLLKNYLHSREGRFIITGENENRKPSSSNDFSRVSSLFAVYSGVGEFFETIFFFTAFISIAPGFFDISTRWGVAWQKARREKDDEGNYRSGFHERRLSWHKPIQIAKTLIRDRVWFIYGRAMCERSTPIYAFKRPFPPMALTTSSFFFFLFLLLLFSTIETQLHFDN